MKITNQEQMLLYDKSMKEIYEDTISRLDELLKELQEIRKGLKIVKLYQEIIEELPKPKE